MKTSPWKIWIDTGGTFTDCLAVSPHGDLRRLKVLSSGLLRVPVSRVLAANKIVFQLPEGVAGESLRGFTIVIGSRRATISAYDPLQAAFTLDRGIARRATLAADITTGEEVPVFATRLITGTPPGMTFPPIALRLGSTRGTNALLEKKGARTALIVTEGFKDLLLIGNQQRANLFSLNVEKKRPLYHTVAEVHERISADGTVLTPIDTAQIKALAKKLRRRKIASVAIALVNSYVNPAHEVAIENALRAAGFSHVCASHDLSAQIKILDRAETAVVNAYLAPIIKTYVTNISEGLGTEGFLMMSSAGGLLPAARFFPKDSLLSGPAGGVLGSFRKASQAGIRKIISFDMGGTSTDVSLCHGRPDYRFECQVGDQRILSPSIAIETIAAGGGSICSFDGYKFEVGPESAGAIPGPACYGAGGPLCITDVNLLLGRIDEENFTIPLAKDAARQRLATLIGRMGKGGKRVAEEEILESFTAIANEKMAEAIRKVSIERGYKTKDYTLLTFGGAGGQHACALARILGVDDILIPYDAGLLSAYGIGHAAIEKIVEKQFLCPLETVQPELDQLLQDLCLRGTRDLIDEGFDARDIAADHVLLFLRLRGQESTVEVEYSKGTDVVAAFRKKYKTIYGHWLPHRTIELESAKIMLRVNPAESRPDKSKVRRHTPSPASRKPLYWAGRWYEAACHRWEKLKPGAAIHGPALVSSNNSTVFVEPGWLFYLGGDNNARLKKTRGVTAKPSASAWAQLELYTNRFTAIAHDMGALMQRASFSVNIKERLDFSCALLDASGRLIVNAPHIPVHLGSLGVCVREVIKKIKPGEGDVIITNHPAYGGSHLPDITLIKPVFFKGKLLAYVANRAHHAEIGGSKPGSMPADATVLAEEGVVIPPMLLQKKGKAQWAMIEQHLCAGQFPTRNVKENLADLNGALASLHEGEQAVQRLAASYGAPEVAGYMRKIFQHGAALMRAKIKRLAGRIFSAVEELDDGTRIQVIVTISGDRMTFDFSGTSPQHPGNLNATKAIVHSVVLYVLRLLIGQPVPLNEGLLEAVRIHLPPCFLNPHFQEDPAASPAVVGGNTEVSQRLTDTLLKAFGLAACSQGTMNNVLFGNADMGYYETICGGTGAGNGFDGADAVHQHMTNTRITDAEVLERRYPVRVTRFSIRKGSGGAGKWRGGNGVIRTLEFLQPLAVNVLGQHRRVAPYGMKGGKPGKRGGQYLFAADAGKKKLSGLHSFIVKAGDRLEIQTPGGGGWGKAS